MFHEFLLVFKLPCCCLKLYIEHAVNVIRVQNKDYPNWREFGQEYVSGTWC